MCAGSNANCGLGRGRGVKGWRFIFPQLRSDTPAIEVAAACGLAEEEERGGGADGVHVCCSGVQHSRGCYKSGFGADYVTHHAIRTAARRNSCIRMARFYGGGFYRRKLPSRDINKPNGAYLSLEGSENLGRLEGSSGNFGSRMRATYIRRNLYPENMVLKRVESLLAFSLIWYSGDNRIDMLKVGRGL